MLNAFPRRVGRFLVPVEGYTLPTTDGDEQAVNLRIIHATFPVAKNYR